VSAPSNTNILIKRSDSTATPSNGSLKAGELAYSYNSNTAFIGASDGSGVLKIGGQLYTKTIDDATAANTASTLVLRDSNSAFYGQLYGNANSATVLQTSRNFSISGSDITASTESFDGSGAIVLNASLNAVDGLTANTYGSTTEIPSVTVAANGRIMSITTNTIATTLNIEGDSGSNNISLLTDTLTFTGGDGITSTVAGKDVTFDLDDTVIRANTSMSGTTQVITTDLQITGNLTITGATQTIDVLTLNISDPLIYLASNNYFTDAVDIGFAGNYFDGANQRHTGLIRHAADDRMYAFTGYTPEPGQTIDPSHSSFVTANLVANIVSANVSGLINAIVVADGGTGLTTFESGQVVIGNGTGTLQQLSNVTSYSATGSSSYIPVITTDVWGRVTDISNTQIQLDTSLIVSGTLPVERGGTGEVSFITGSILVGNGTDGLQELSNTTFSQTGTGLSNNTITSVTVDAYGRFTEATFAEIAGLKVNQGGTGLSTITTNGITFGNSLGDLGVTAAAGSSDQSWSNQILTVTNAGVPVWTTALDGGTF
jgi:hypothetical protein